MLNFRKLRQDFSSSVLKEGKSLFEKGKVVSAKILSLDQRMVCFSGKVCGNFENTYESEIEIDRFESLAIHSNCDCSYRYDCQHLAALIFYLEQNIDSLIVQFSKEADLSKDENFDTEQREKLLETIKNAESKEEAKRDAHYQKQVLDEYKEAAEILSSSAFFQPLEEGTPAQADLSLIFTPKILSTEDKKKGIEIQLALRLPSRSKPLAIPSIRDFLDVVRYEEPIRIGGKRYFFSLDSFNEGGKKILSFLMDHAHSPENAKGDRSQRLAFVDVETFGLLLAHLHEMALRDSPAKGFSDFSEDILIMPGVFLGTLEFPLQCSFSPAQLRFDLDYIEPPVAKLLLKPSFVIDQNAVSLNEALLLECVSPGVIFRDIYYRFPNHVKRIHLRNLLQIRDMTVPEPLFGTFVENALPELKRFAEIGKQEVIEKFVTLPFAGELKAKCSLSYLNGELEASLTFFYDDIQISSRAGLSYDEIEPFVTSSGILARDLVLERQILEDLFQDFTFSPEQGTYIAKTEKKIVEFMTEVIPRNKGRVEFECPQNLLDQFVYDKTSFILSLDYNDKVGYYTIDISIKGELKNVRVDLLWDCIAAKRSFIEYVNDKKNGKKEEPRFSRILIIDLDRIHRIVHIFDEMGIKKLDDHSEERPLWTLVNIEESLFEGLPVRFSMTEKLKEIRKQMLGESSFTPSPIPSEIKVDLRPYQKEGVYWLEKLRKMYLNGILADDMGLGKTLQAIVAMVQSHQLNPENPSLVICPTSLLYNWKEEISRFAPSLKVLVVDGIPSQRKKLVTGIGQYDVAITSYTLMQKDVELYQSMHFSYLILDEAQHIKNRSTRNAKSAKMIPASYRLILTGTPIENSLEELWSLFDFLMPGLLSTYDRFVDKYIRSSGEAHTKQMHYLKRKVAPFILRRMKVDVLDDLPPISEITYRCQLADLQLALYRSYAQAARDELVKLVEKEGFDKVQIHVLATLTRLKQICCHPAIFAKERPEVGDSAKYEMLLELLQTLVTSGHRTVIFSQYTRMLQIMRDDFKQKGIAFSYLDGTSKNRLQIVREFNENASIPVFLISLKAGGSGLNIIGADTVIHYDLWWNPAVENQATDRVYRIGQTKAVSSYKLVTLGSIEEKIVEMQKRKRGLVKKVVSCDEEVISKLTWEEVLELLQT